MRGWVPTLFSVYTYYNIYTSSRCFTTPVFSFRQDGAHPGCCDSTMVNLYKTFMNILRIIYEINICFHEGVLC